VVQVIAAPETVSTVYCSDPLQLARACYHLGNRHVPLQIAAGFVRYQHDHVLDDMLRGFGLDPQVMLAAINRSSGRSGSTEHKWPNFIVPGTYDSGFGLSLMLKDMRIATGLAERLGVPHTLSAQAVAHWSTASEQLGAGADHTEVARWLTLAKEQQEQGEQGSEG